MLPNLHGNGEVAGSAVQVPPPPDFRAPLLPLRFAYLGEWIEPPLKGQTESQKRGLRYEAKVHLALRGIFNYKYKENQAIKFADQRGLGLCIPDAIIRSFDYIVIVEVKSQHMPESWWQLRRKYEPLIRFIYPESRVLLLEICKSLDASMPYPERYDNVENVEKWIEHAKDGKLGVHQWTL